jgi:hypothetical protein
MCLSGQPSRSYGPDGVTQQGCVEIQAINGTGAYNDIMCNGTGTTITRAPLCKRTCLPGVTRQSMINEHSRAHFTVQCAPVQNTTIQYNLTASDPIISNISVNNNSMVGTIRSHTCAKDNWFMNNYAATNATHTYVCTLMNASYAEWQLLLSNGSVVDRTPGDDCYFSTFGWLGVTCMYSQPMQFVQPVHEQRHVLH